MSNLPPLYAELDCPEYIYEEEIIEKATTVNLKKLEKNNCSFVNSSVPEKINDNDFESNDLEPSNQVVSVDEIKTPVEFFDCTVCGKTLKTKSSLNVHKKTHLGVKDFLCNLCLKRFANETYLKRHLRTHEPSKIFQCHKCDKSFVTKEYLHKHFNTKKCKSKNEFPL